MAAEYPGRFRQATRKSGFAAARSALVAGRQARIVAAGLLRVPDFKMESDGSATIILNAGSPTSNLRDIAPDRPVVL